MTIETTFEVLLDGEQHDCPHLEYLQAKLSQCKSSVCSAILFAKKLDEQVFPNLVVVGWFTLGSSPDSWATTFHAALPPAIFDNPLLLILDPQQLTTQNQEDTKHATQLPLRVFEKPINTVLSTQDEQQSFAELSWKLETGEAERIAVDHISKAQNTGHSAGQDTESLEEDALVTHLTSHANAVKMLRSRISLLRGYVAAVKDGSVEADPDILKSIGALMQRLPLQESAAFHRESQRERTDVIVTRQAAELMTGSRLLGELIEMYAAIKSRRGPGSRHAAAAAAAATSSTAMGDYGTETSNALPTGWV